MDNNSFYNKRIVDGHYLPSVVAYYFREWNGYNMAFHVHNQVEIMYVISGRCTVETEGSAYNMKNGDFIFLDANTPHRLAMEKDQRCRMLNVEFGFVERSKGEGELNFPSIKEVAACSENLRTMLSKGQPFMVLKDSDEVYHILKTLVIELDGADSDSKFMVNSLLNQLIVRIARFASEYDTGDYSMSGLHVKKALEYIHHNYDCDINVEGIAGAINIHPGYLHRIFKSNTGATVVEYLTSLRIEKAKMLLEQTDIPIIDISNYIGINSRQYFTYIFKKHVGITPYEFRRSFEKVKYK